MTSSMDTVYLWKGELLYVCLWTLSDIWPSKWRLNSPETIWAQAFGWNQYIMIQIIFFCWNKLLNTPNNFTARTSCDELWIALSEICQKKLLGWIISLHRMFNSNLDLTQLKTLTLSLILEGRNEKRWRQTVISLPSQGSYLSNLLGPTKKIEIKI